MRQKLFKFNDDTIKKLEYIKKYFGFTTGVETVRYLIIFTYEKIKGEKNEKTL